MNSVVLKILHISGILRVSPAICVFIIILVLGLTYLKMVFSIVVLHFTYNYALFI